MKFQDIFTRWKSRQSNYDEKAVQFVNSKGLKSNTKYLIWVDLSNFKVNIYTGKSGQWNLLKSYVCTIGKTSTPTPKGTFSVGIKGLYFGVEKGCIY